MTSGLTGLQVKSLRITRVIVEQRLAIHYPPLATVPCTFILYVVLPALQKGIRILIQIVTEEKYNHSDETYH